MAFSSKGPSLKEGSVTVDCTNAGREELKRKIDFLILKLICVTGICPSVVDWDEWKDMWAIGNPRYKPTGSTTFTDKYISQESSQVHKQTVKILRGYENNTLTFDGNDTRGCESVYTTHFTTPDWQTFLFHGYEGTGEHHTAEWVKGKIVKTVNEVRKQHVSTVCSDSAANVKLGKQLAQEEIPTLLILPDACHHISLMIKDITKLSEYTSMIKTLKDTLSFFSSSKFAMRKLKELRKEEDRQNRWKGDLIVDGTVNVKDKNVSETFKGQMKGTTFQFTSVQYSRVVGPMARSIWQLEAVQTNAADVFLFWLAMGAKLKALLDAKETDTGITVSLASKIRHIFNARYREFIEESPGDIYFTCFFLHPLYGKSDILKKSSPGTVQNATITIPAQSASNRHEEADQTPNPKAYRRVKEALLDILKREHDLFEQTPLLSPLPGVMKALNNEVKLLAIKFKAQLVAFAHREFPFSDPLATQTPLQWWHSLLPNPKARVLAFLAVKLFSSLANSMPDERTGSGITWLNSPLRNRQKVDTLMCMLKIGQWYSVHQKGAKVKAEPTVNFTDVGEVLKASDSVKPNQKPTDEQPQVHLINELPQDKENLDQDADESPAVVDEDIDIDCTLLKQVVPKETDKKSGKWPPIVLAGLVALDMPEPTRPSGVVAGGSKFEWASV
ncbi:hypothetical protein V5O48_017368 [Marasmius crinis-equi]|uniref:DUF659 domain-containing protein n=1 Tax=Marasmius crinis-equi TaxID=585013 RepID=A0ABR3EPB6_9AGAR